MHISNIPINAAINSDTNWLIFIIAITVANKIWTLKVFINYIENMADKLLTLLQYILSFNLCLLLSWEPSGSIKGNKTISISL